MSLLMLDGGDDSLRTLKWSQLTGTWTTEPGRTGNGWRMTSSGAGDSYMRRDLTSLEEHATLTAGFVCRLAAYPLSTDPKRGRMISWLSDAAVTRHVELGVNNVGRLQVFRGPFFDTGGTFLGGSDPGVLQLGGVFHSVEMSVVLSDTVGVVQVKVDGALVIDLSGIDTKNGGTKTVFDAWRFSIENTNIIQPVFDDFYLTNGAGVAPWGGFLGDVQIETKYPDGNGYLSQWTGSDLNSVDNFLLVDENPPDGDTTYVESVVDGDIDAYTVGNMTATGIVRGVQATADARHVGAADNARVFTRIAAVNHNGPDQAVPAGYAAGPSAVWGPSPATTVAWTTAEFNGAEFGIEDRP